MDIETVTSIFCRLSGLNSTQAEEFSFFCESSLAYVMTRLKSGIDETIWGGRIAFAAAAMAYYRFILWSLTDGGGNEIKVGELSVRKSVKSEAETAETLCRDAFGTISSVLADEGFVFERM